MASFKSNAPFNMNSLPLPALAAALAALVAAPFSAAAAGTLFLTAGLGAIVHADYVQRHQRVRLPKVAQVRHNSNTRRPFRTEPNQLAA
jgi:hypothetical protein